MSNTSEMMKTAHPTPPFGGWNRRQREPAALLHGMVGRAVGAFHRMPHVRGPGMPATGEYLSVSGPDTGGKIEPGIRSTRHRRSPLALLRSRRHGKDRILRYIILPAIAILTAVGIIILLRN